MRLVKYLIGFLVLLFSVGQVFADYTCTVPTDGTFNECVALCDGKTGVVTIDVTGEAFTMSSFSMAAWEASSVVIKGAGRDSTSTSSASTITAAASIPFEIYGITFNANLTINGAPIGFKIHDNTFAASVALKIYWSVPQTGHAYGVVYKNNLHKVTVYEEASNRFDAVHELFTQSPPFGSVGSASNGVVYIEGNTYNDRGMGYLTDSENGGRMVFRYNTINAVGSSANLAVHSINNSSTYSGSSYVMRGTQMWEWYKNEYNTSVYSAMFSQIRSGTGVIFDNKITRTTAGGGVSAFHLDNDRSNYSATYNDGSCRGHFGWDENTTIDSTNSVNTTYYGNTHFSGTHSGDNNASILTDSTAAWTASRLAPSSTSPGTTVYNVTDGSKCLITANDGTTITCTLSGGADNDWDTGDSYRISNGYPCRDQIGWAFQNAEQFDNNPLNSTAQSLYPVYIWGNTRNGVAMNTISVPSGSDKHIQNNREYYTSTGASCTAGGDCTSGVGSGSAKPTSCTVNTAFWDTDESALYKCTEPATWTKYYEPATCPHPLAGAGTCGATPGVTGYSLTGGASAPILVSATLAADGVTLSLLFSRAITTTINTGVTVTPSSGVATAAYASGTTTTTLVYTLSRAISSTANGGSLTVSYTQPGNGLEATDDGQDVLTFTNTSVINNSTQGNTLKTVTPSAGTGCNISPDVATTVVSGLTAVFYTGANRNYSVSSIGGTCGGSGTDTYTTDAVTEDCTVTVSCTKISPDVVLGTGAVTTLGTGAVGTLY